MNRVFFKAVVRVVRDIMKNESEPSGGKVITADKFYLYLRRYTRGDDSRNCEKTYVKFVLPNTCAYALDPGSAADLAKLSEFLLQIVEGRYPTTRVDDHNSRDLDFVVHDAALDSANVSPEADDADDDKRAHNVNVLIDVVYPGINADELPNEYF
ncbi:Helitron helicase, partial [Phytophthora megakarya]